MENIWNLLDEGNDKDIEHIVDMLKIERTLANLLVMRGISHFEDAKTFFRPELIQLHDPFMMKGMDKAVERVQKAIDKNEKILVYGDYDVDGITSVSMVYKFLETKNLELGYYIPDRYIEGYGISYKGIDYAHENGFSLVIALDCGIKAVDKIEYANRLNIDFIICDHHTPDDKIPDAVAVLDPKRIDCDYPFKELSGCGVGFKLIQAFVLSTLPEDFLQTSARNQNKVLHEKLAHYLDFATVSIAADIVPVVGENRILAYFGLKQLNKTPNIGLKAIMEVIGLDDKVVNITDLVFKLGPRINAAGRIQKGFMAVKLLVCNDEDAAILLSREIDEYNTIRKGLDQSITEDAFNQIKLNPKLNKKRSTVLYNANWHKGVIGIVASRLTEAYHRPTIILTESNGLATGSARSVVGFDLYSAVSECVELLEAFGGHKYAAGLTLKIENIPEFTEKFERIVTEKILPEQLRPQINIDAKINFTQITPKFYRILKQFAPFGPENMTPIFMSKNVYDTGGSRLVGVNNDHLRLEVIQGTTTFHGIGFSLSHCYNIVKSGRPFKICYSIDENNFRGSTNLQLIVKDIKPQNDMS